MATGSGDKSGTPANALELRPYSNPRLRTKNRSLENLPRTPRNHNRRRHIDREDREAAAPPSSQKRQALRRQHVEHNDVQQVQPKTDFPRVTQPRRGQASIKKAARFGQHSPTHQTREKNRERRKTQIRAQRSSPQPRKSREASEKSCRRDADQNPKGAVPRKVP